MSVDTRLEELGVSDLDVSGWGNHGLSQIYIGEDCHLSQLMREADEAGLDR